MSSSSVDQSVGVAQAEIEKQEAKVKDAKEEVKEAKEGVKEAETKVENAREEVKQAEVKVKEAETKVEKAESKVKETQTGTEWEKATAKKGLESAQKGLESAQKGLESAQKGLESAQEGVNTAQRLCKIAVTSLERASGAAGGAHAASRTAIVGDDMSDLARQVQQLQLKLAQESQRADQESQRAEQESQRAEQESQRAELESQRAELESQKNHILTTKGDALFLEVCTEFTAYVKNKDCWLRGGGSAPAPLISETASVSSSSTGSNASKVPFPNNRVDCSLWSVESEQVPYFLKPLLWKMQQRLVSMYDAFGTSSMGEVDHIQPVIRAFCSVVVKEMQLNLEVVYPGDGVRVDVDWSGSTVKGSPDIVFHSKMRAPNGHWARSTSASLKKLCKAVILGEVKKNQAAVRNASESQARCYLFGTAECLSEQHLFKGLFFSATRTCFCTDGFCWRFMQCSGVPGQADTSKWSIAASNSLHEADDIVLYLTHVLKSYVMETTTKAKDGNDSKGSGSLSAEKMLDEGNNDSAEFSAESDGSDHHNAHEINSQQHDEGSQSGMTAQKLFSTPLSLQRKCSSASESDTFRKRTLHARGDGLPRGLDTKAFVEMQSRERVLAFLEM